MPNSIPEQVVHLTEQMRRGETREMRDLRGVLASRCIDVNRTVCAGASGALLDVYICVLILPNGDAIEYVASYDDLDDPEGGPATSTDWHEYPERFDRDWIAAGRALLRR